MIPFSLSDLTPVQLARAREDLKADEALYRSFLDQGMTTAQVASEMVKRGHGERYVSLLARRLAPTEARKEPIDSDIEKRRKTAGDPPAGTINNPTPRAGKPEAIDSMDDKPAKAPLSQQQWLLGERYEAVHDPQTGLAKWPLSFKRIERDTKRPNKIAAPNATKPGKATPEQPPTCA